MKTIIRFSIICILNIGAFAQNSIQTIDVSSQVDSKVIPIEPNTYAFKIINADKEAIYGIKVEKENLEIEKLAIPSTMLPNYNSLVEIPIDTFAIGRGQVLKITITETKTVDKSTTKKTFIYTYLTPKRGEWRTTFGFNFVYLTKQNTYFSKSNNVGGYIVTESNNKEKFQYHPAFMFTWLDYNNLCNGCYDWKYGFSGGIGYNFKTSVAVFTGISLIYNENITITTGLAFHNQKRLTSNYSEGDIIYEDLTLEQLHTDYIRVNPFISISLRLDKNPFGD